MKLNLFKKGAFTLALLAGACGGGAGSGSQGRDIDKVPAGAVDPSVERYKVPVGTSAVQGPGNAKVTIIEYSDFQCPFCSRVVPTIEQIQKNYPNQIRFAFKHNPLPFHQNAMPAAQAAVAAQRQGKFWEMYDRLFKNQQELTKESFEKWAKELGLNVDKFKKDMDSPETQKQVKDEMAEAAKYGARGTPSFFLNGRPFSGAQPYENFKKLVDEEVAAADKAIKAGVAPDQVYAALIKGGKDAAAAAPNQPNQPPPMDQTVFKVPVGDAPQKGPADAKVTIVEFSDFQCPFCSRVEGTMAEVVKTYGNDVRIAWKNNPLPFHEHAMDAALASLAAHKQGKFWEMHEVLFKNQGALDVPSLEKYAGELGLNMDKFKAVMKDEAAKKSIQDDAALAAQLGARGTPSFFINGKNLRGAQPFPAFKTAIDAALKDADAQIAKGTAKADVYAELTKNGKEKVEAPPQPKAPPADTTVYKALVGDAPVKGPKTAKVTIVEWSDFQCPFCSRVEPTVDQVMKAFPNDVRVAFKQLPLPFHNNAHLAAEAALAAKEQGKFWEMHAALFKNQQALDRPSLEKYATELGLNLGKFKEALDSGKFKKKVDDELAEGNKIGAQGTPSFFINGKKFVGAQPFEAFKTKIEEELKAADALMAKDKIKADKVYDTLMKDAKEGAAPPPQAAADEPKPEHVNIDPGSAPMKGPKNAPITVVIFSDFQCPFCSRVEPTLAQLEKDYAGKIRFAWKDQPLPFHDKAMPAAEAARAAGAQGKFWEMHDKLFANQQSLDRPSFEKFATELGLDLGKFKADLDSHKFQDQIKKDSEEGTKVGAQGTPTFFINGWKLVGAQPIDAFKKLIDQQLKAPSK